jgi:hypothetical protein
VPENKQRMSLAHRGSGHSGRKKGWHHTPEAKEKLRLVNTSNTPTKRLEKENQVLKTEQTQRLERLEARLTETKRILDTWRKVANDNYQLSLGKYLNKDGKWVY